MKIGLFFGTYNPVHVGHMVIANYMVEYTDLDQICDRLWRWPVPESFAKTRNGRFKTAFAV